MFVNNVSTLNALINVYINKVVRHFDLRFKCFTVTYTIMQMVIDDLGLNGNV